MQTTQLPDPEFIVSAWPLANYYGVNSIGGACGDRGIAYVRVHVARGYVRDPQGAGVRPVS